MNRSLVTQRDTLRKGNDRLRQETPMNVVYSYGTRSNDIGSVLANIFGLNEHPINIETPLVRQSLHQTPLDAGIVDLERGSPLFIFMKLFTALGEHHGIDKLLSVVESTFPVSLWKFGGDMLHKYLGLFVSQLLSGQTP